MYTLLTYLGMDLLPRYIHIYMYLDHQFVSVTARSKPPLVL